MEFLLHHQTIHAAVVTQGREEMDRGQRGARRCVSGPARHPSCFSFHLPDTTRQKRPTLDNDYAHLVSYLIGMCARRRSRGAATLTVVIFMISRGVI